MNFSLRCILGHRWEPYAYQDRIRTCDNKVVGAFVLQRCTICGKLNRRVFA